AARRCHPDGWRPPGCPSPIRSMWLIMTRRQLLTVPQFITDQSRRRKMVHRPAMIRDQDTIEIRLTRDAEYRLPFTLIEALNEGPLFDRPAHVFRDAARQHRLFHVANRTTENILGTGVVQPSSVGDTSRTQAEVGGLMVHPAARGFGLASLLLK